MDARDAAVAGLAEDLGRALLRFASQLRASTSSEGRGEIDQEAPTPPPAPEVPAAPTPGDARLRGLGASQRRVLEVVQEAGEGGTTAQRVAAATGLKSTNTPRMLKTLAERGVVSSWGSNPIIWYART